MNGSKMVNFQKKCISSLSIFLLLIMGLNGLFILPGNVIADNEPNDSFGTAEIITPGEFIGEINATDLEDYYQIELQNGSVVQITYTADPAFDQYLTFYNPSQIEVLQLSSNTNSIDSGYYHLAWETVVDYWFIKINGELGNYTFNVTITYQNDADSGDDAPPDYTNAYEIQDTVQVTGKLWDLDQTDMYKIYVESGSIINVTFWSNADWDQILAVYNPSRVEIMYLTSNSDVIVTEQYFLANETNSDYWYIGLTEPDGYYNFTVNLLNQNDGGSGHDVASVSDTAYEITSGMQVNGHLEDLDTADMYKVFITNSSIINITYSASSYFDLYCYVYNTYNSYIFDLSSNNQIIVYNEYYLANETENGYYYFGIMNEEGDYTLTVTLRKQNDANSGTDAANDYDRALEIQADTVYQGILMDLDTLDIFKIYLEGGSIVNITFSSDSYYSMYLYLYTPSKIYQISLYSAENEEVFGVHNIGFAETADYWFVRVYGSTGNYNFKVSVAKQSATPPKIFNVTVTSPYSGMMMISWETDVPTNGTVMFGLTTTYGLYAYSSSFYFTTDHTAYIYSAEEGMRYHFKVVSYNELGVKNETKDDTFVVPRSKYIYPEYNSLRTFIFGSVSGKIIGSKLEFKILCFDKGLAITPDSIQATSATNITNISLTNPATGVYMGTYTLSLDDINAGEVTIFVDVTYKGNNDTVLYSTDISIEDDMDEWVVNIEYFSSGDQTAGFGDTINLKIIVTKNDKKADPENLTVTISEEFYYPTRSYLINFPLTPIKIGTGEYKVSFTLPAKANESKEYSFNAEIIIGEDYEWDYFSHQVDIYNIWYHLLSITNKSAQFDVYVTDLDNQLITSGFVEMVMEYYTPTWELMEDKQNETIDSTGKTSFNFNNQDITESYYDIEGRAVANGMTQYFSAYLSVPQDTVSWEPEPDGDQLEIIPIPADNNVLSGSYIKPDSNGNIKVEFYLYSDSELLNDTEVFYYIVTGQDMYSSYSTDNDLSMELVKTGSTKTTNMGIFTLEFKEQTTRQDVPDFRYYTVLVEVPIGSYEEYMDRRAGAGSRWGSADGLYYAEAYEILISMDMITSLTLTFEELISNDIKITIPKLNRGTPTDIEVKYTGTFVNPMVMVNFYPGSFDVETNIMYYEPTWGLWSDDSGYYLSDDDSDGVYTGKFTIPSFMQENTYTILVAVQNPDYLDYISSLSYFDYIRVNLVILDIGGSVKDAGYEGKDEPKPDPSKIDTDKDTFTDAIEKSFGTDPNDPNSYPGSAAGQDYTEDTIGTVNVMVTGTTTGNLNMNVVPPAEVPPVPEEVGKHFNVFIDITCDSDCTNIKIVLNLGKIGQGVIPAGTVASSIKLFYYDDTTKEWKVVENSKYDAETGLLSASIDHLTVFSPMSSEVQAEKEGDGDSGAGLGGIVVYILLIIIVVVVIISLLGVVMRMRKGGKGGEREYRARGPEADMRVQEPDQAKSEAETDRDELDDFMEPEPGPEQGPEPGPEPKPEPADTDVEPESEPEPSDESEETAWDVAEESEPESEAEGSGSAEVEVESEAEPESSDEEWEELPVEGEPGVVEEPGTEPSSVTGQENTGPEAGTDNESGDEWEEVADK